ncbi:MAG: hypothetical protein AAF447_27325 [Myxococcota bacterium]
MRGLGALAVVLGLLQASVPAGAQAPEEAGAPPRLQLRGLEGFAADVAVPAPEVSAPARAPRVARPLQEAPGPLRWFLRSLVPTLAHAHGDGGEGWAAGFELRPLAIVLSGETPRALFLPGDTRALHAGSLEFFGGAWHRLERAEEQGPRDSAWLAKAGIRGLLPLARNGETLSASVGAGYLRTFDAQSPAYELGLYGLSGAIGTTFTFSAHTDVRAFLWTFELRPF